MPRFATKVIRIHEPTPPNRLFSGNLQTRWVGKRFPASVFHLGSIAEFERELIKSRTSEGRQRAKLRGVKFGRKPKLSLHQIKEVLARKQRGEAMADIGRSYNVSHSTISRLS